MARKKTQKQLSRFNQETIKAILIGLSVIAFWRGAWGLMDMYLFPEDGLISYVFSLIIGIGILVATRYITKELM